MTENIRITNIGELDQFYRNFDGTVERFGQYVQRLDDILSGGAALMARMEKLAEQQEVRITGAPQTVAQFEAWRASLAPAGRMDGICDEPGCEADATEEDLTTGRQSCPAHHVVAPEAPAAPKKARSNHPAKAQVVDRQDPPVQPVPAVVREPALPDSDEPDEQQD